MQKIAILGRHGKAANPQKIMYMASSDPLDIQGETQIDLSAATLSLWLRHNGFQIEGIVASGIVRARQSAERMRNALGLTHLAVQEDNRIEEFRWSRITGMPVDDFGKKIATAPDSFNVPGITPPDESLLEAVERVRACVTLRTPSTLTGCTLYMGHQLPWSLLIQFIKEGGKLPLPVCLADWQRDGKLVGEASLHAIEVSGITLTYLEPIC